jgi:aspartate/methionine/tyrosine aminotransferase
MSFKSVPLERELVDAIVAEHGINVGTASIREVNRVISAIEERTGLSFIRMEFGIPGLEPDPIAVEAEIIALRDEGLARIYAPFDGVPALKEAGRDFVHAFMDLDLPASCCIPTVGAMHGGFISMGIAGRRFADRDTILFLDPGFPVNKLQCRVWGLENDSIDVYDHRGEKLLAAIEERFATGRVGGLLYSNPNNPSWVCFKESELEGIGRLCSEYQVIAIEDLAYFGMDFRAEYGIPYEPPFQPTVARYTDQYILLISSSKIFSYAGQRVALAVVSPALFDSESENLERYFGTKSPGYAFVHGGIYPTTAGVPEGPQHGLAAILRAAVSGELRFTEPVREYARRAEAMKAAFLENGFRLVYDNDLGEPLADGFYFTVTYPGFDCAGLLEELVYYGISAIGLNTTGSRLEEGIRACVSLTPFERVPELRHRLEAFHSDHG